ncbi:hypothetical protein RB623_21530 [Mesorhizobium sp. LHD-90]|uniref:hypothetical protein n=1 Tax=Mesorhizobium sp. LHD-90 TaxID=3071414 RepID=UPI0027E1A76D|nr:hypothetical protein [Mesorhizobium sp. LHD-90]MDQ6436639.1 hypothetical protein [Mesorhizobium sp. LHD-90]
MGNSETSTNNNIGKYIEEYANASNYNYRDLAIMAGFTSANILYQFMSGRAKVPLDRVPGLAEALRCDPSHLFVLALEQYIEPNLFQQMRELVVSVTVNERGWIDAIRQASSGSDPRITPDQAAELKAMLAP